MRKLINTSQERKRWYDLCLNDAKRIYLFTWPSIQGIYYIFCLVFLQINWLEKIIFLFLSFFLLLIKIIERKGKEEKKEMIFQICLNFVQISTKIKIRVWDMSGWWQIMPHVKVADYARYGRNMAYNAQRRFDTALQQMPEIGATKMWGNLSCPKNGISRRISHGFMRTKRKLSKKYGEFWQQKFWHIFTFGPKILAHF